MKSIIVLSSKGGVGKTLTAVDVALGLGRKDKVLFLDADAQNEGSGSTWLTEIGEEHPDLKNVTWDKISINKIVDEFKSNSEFDWVVVDTPPQLNDTTLVAAAQKASIAVVPGGHGADLKATTATLNTLAQKTEVPCLAVITDVDPRSLETAKRASGQLRALGYKVCKTPIRHYQGLDDARLYGETPYDIARAAAENHLEDVKALVAAIKKEINNA